MRRRVYRAKKKPSKEEVEAYLRETGRSFRKHGVRKKEDKDDN